MVLDPNVLNEAAAPRTLRISAREIVPQVQPAISVGEVLRFSVRSNNEGQGQLYFRGLLIPAQLPPELQTGDKVFAQVTEANNQLVLRILQTNPAEVPQAAGSPLPNTGGPAQSLIASQVGDILRETLVQLTHLRTEAQAAPASSPPLLAAEQTFEQATEILTTAFDRISVNVATAQSLSDPQSAHAQLIDSTSGKAIQTLRVAAGELRQLAGGSAPAGAERFIADLQSELEGFLEDSIKNNFFSKRHLDAFIGGAAQELRGSRPTPLKEREALNATIRDLQDAKDHPEKAQAQIEQATKRLFDLVTANGRRADVLGAKAKYDLEGVAGRLEQLANAQETLNQLNPMMQALGEPALILFPFLAHGLLNHSELSFESSLDRKGLGGGRDDEEQNGEVDTTPYQRIQINVPLPEMGTVHVDVAHRNDEMLVSFSVADPEASEFVKAHLEELGAILRLQKFTKVDLSTHIGAPDDLGIDLPPAFHVPRTIVA